MSYAKTVNLTLKELCVRRDHESRVALEFNRGTKWSEYLAFDPRGVQVYRLETVEFHKRFTRTLSSSLEGAASAFLRSLKDAYLPWEGAADVLLEILIMAKTNGSKDLSAMDAKELVAYHNQLAFHVPGIIALKSWKNAKSELVARIKELEGKVKQPTAAQQKHAADGKPAETEAKPKRKAEPVAKGGKVTVSKTPKAKPAKSEKAPAAPRGQGIGAFCMDLLGKGKSNEEVLSAVKAKFPDAKTSAASVAWYRNKLVSEGKL